ncbi:MAG: hypothetical protein QXE31_03710 [Candidatus Woesearchaeota archaeon]
MPIKIIADLIKFKIKFIAYLARHSKKSFKFLFWIDDFIRIFAMTILFMLIARILNLNALFSTILFFIGVIVDIEDFINNKGIGKLDI